MAHWRPIPLLQVDVDTLVSSDLSQIEPGERVWLEVTRQGNVVGLLDVRASDEGLTNAMLQGLLSPFKKAKPRIFESVADEKLLSASVVVPTLNHNPAELSRLVESLIALDYPEFEIIVVDNRSDAERDPIPAFPGGQKVRVVHEPQRGVSAARNLGIAVAAGDILAFTDDDAIVDRNWLRAIGTLFMLDPEVEGIGGLVLPMVLATPPQLWFEEFYGGFSPSFQFEKLSIERLKGVDKMFPYAPGRYGAGCNAAYRRSTLQRLRGFDVAIGGGTLARGGEDVALAIELVVTGGTFAYEPAALVRHTHRRTEREFMQQALNYGVGLTAMYSAMIVRDPRHLTSLIRRIPVGFQHLIRSPEDRSPSSTPSYPPRTILYQMLGMIYGPIGYARSLLRIRRARMPFRHVSNTS